MSARSTRCTAQRVWAHSPYTRTNPISRSKDSSTIVPICRRPSSGGQIRLSRSMNTLIPYSRRTYMRLWIMENVLFPPSRSLPGNITNTTTLKELIFPATAISRSQLPIWQLILIMISSETTTSSWTQGFYMWPTTTFPPERNSGPGETVISARPGTGI